jgi:hypothetical protein
MTEASGFNRRILNRSQKLVDLLVGVIAKLLISTPGNGYRERGQASGRFLAPGNHRILAIMSLLTDKASTVKSGHASYLDPKCRN